MSRAGSWIHLCRSASAAEVSPPRNKSEKSDRMVVLDVIALEWLREERR